MTLLLSAVETLPPHLDELRADVRTFLDREVAEGRFTPESDAWLSGIDPEFSLRLAERGWVGMTIPTQYGGSGRSDLERFVVTEELLAAGAPVAAHWIADRQMAPGILRNGTEEQKRTYLPGIARGERYFGIGMSEPDAGSDLAAIRTSAIKTTDGWRISGTKLWTSGAHIATNMVLLARTDASDDRHGGFSQFLVDLPHPQIDIKPIITIDGGHHFNEVVFDDALVPASALLGQRGDGWRQVTQELANERSGPERILSTLPLLRAWARTDAVQTDAAVRSALGRLISRMTVLRQLSISVAQELAAGRNPAVEAAMVKDLGTVFEGDVVETIRAHAGIEPDPHGDEFSVLLAKSILHTPGFTLRGGTNEVLRSIVAKAVL
ncbi:acyl-CoA dehydrogenase family protein [Pseudarthrobacter sulfonivorans]|uniref:acyl-CoA dehydrogenase family protein n=1 Tax=Pseudarthrobacter sulfonivorans TaxID=121292 RepID=UPI00168BA8A9|nr:acyl-CoA dehydrogenase family protein [Pseudarthrobacter sulfonivorans]